MTRLFLQLNKPGSGETTINQNDPAAADIAFGKFIRIVYRGEDRGGFFVDNIDQNDVSAGEEGERNVDVKGRGMLGILDNMIVYYLTQGETTVVYSAKKIGYILDDLLSLAQARGSYANLIWDFNALIDSEGEAWTVNQDLSFRVGSTILDALEQFVELGVDFTMSFNPGADQYVLSAFKDGIGDDVSASVVFQPGESMMKASKLQEASGLKNVQLVEIADPSAGPLFAENTVAVSIASYGRREYYYQAGNATTVAQGLELAEADINRLKDPRVQYSLVVSDAVGPKVFEDYNIGDTVGYLNSEGTIDLVQVISLQLDFTKEQYYADVTVGLGVFIIDTEITSAKKIKKLAPGVTGSSGGGPSDPANVAGALIGAHDALVTAHSPYLRNANKIQGFDVVDPGVDTPSNNDLLQYVSVDANWAYVSPAAVSFDHGSLSGLGDDDHTQYLLADGTRALAGAWDMGSQILTNVNIDSGVITGITDLAIADGGTGASTAADARTNLGLVAGGAGDIWVEKAGDTMTGQLFIDGGADEIQNIIQANATQTANLIEWQNSAGNPDFTFLNGAAVFNAQGNDADHQIQGNTEADLIYVNAGTDRVGFGTNAPQGTRVHVMTPGSATSEVGFVLENPSAASFANVSVDGLIEGVSRASFTFQRVGTGLSGVILLRADNTSGASQRVIDITSTAAIVNAAQVASMDLIAMGDTEANLFRVDAGVEEVRMGDWDTNYFTTDLNGDSWWVGGGGLPFGHCYGNEIAWTQASAAQNTWYDISDADMVSGNLHLVTHDGSGQLTVSLEGMYDAVWNGSFEADAANVHVQVTFSVNGTEDLSALNHFETIGVSRQSPAGGNTILDLAAGDTVNLSIRTTDAGTPDLSIDHLMFKLVQIGGT